MKNKLLKYLYHKQLDLNIPIEIIDAVEDFIIPKEVFSRKIHDIIIAKTPEQREKLIDKLYQEI